MRVPALVLLVMATASLSVRGQDQPWWPVALPPDADPAPGAFCLAPNPDGRIRAAAVADGGALSYHQDPPWLLARDDHGLRLREFTVAGDVDRVRFDRWDQEANRYVEETWLRERTDTRAGRLVSVFEPSWPAPVVQTRLARARVGFDAPELWLGYYRGAADAPNVFHPVSVRVGSTAIARADVSRIDDTIQYASHVVNLVIPDFGDSRLTNDVNLATVARKFYEHFEDSYDVLAVIPEDAQVDAYGAYHQRVKNDITGLGQRVFNQSAAYGSAGRLRGIELFHRSAFGGNDTSSHELTHTWSHDFDWTRIAGIARAGHVPTSHGPLISGGESLVNAVLSPGRRVALRDGATVIERSPAPIRQHPLELYAMGLLDAAGVSELTLFEDQAQFDATSTSSPSPGTAVGGGRRTVSVNDIMAAHGSRQGPVLTEIRRAAIVVSRERLLPPEEMAYWNFHAARHEDAARTGVVDYDGQGSFDLSTARRIDLITDIRPRGAAALPPTQDPEPARFGRLDCRGFEFSTPPPTRVRAGQRFTIAGRVTARDRSDFHRALFRFWPSDDVTAKEEEADTDVSRSGEFRVDIEIRSGREGQYSVDGFLFWPGAAPQYPRCRLSVLTVTP